jgi:hypothetical protein
VRAPNKSRLDEVVREIVTELDGQPVDELDRLSAEVDVRATVRLLCELDREVGYRRGVKRRTPFRGKRQENVDDLMAILKQTKALQKAIGKASSPALFLLVSGERDVTSDKVPPTEVQQRIEPRLRQITGMLAYLRARCDFLLAQRPGEHASADYRQRRVAHEAWRLLRRHKKEPASGVAASLYGRIASLLYEAMTGEYGKDLERACKAALILASKGGLSDDGIPIRAAALQMNWTETSSKI